jgi:NarL family two-component system response regulator LiaR
MLTRHEGDERLIEAMLAGATSYLLKGTSPSELVLAFERTARGESALHPRAAAAMVHALSVSTAGSESAVDALTGREAEVLHLIDAGFPNAVIAQRLAVSKKTVKNRVSSILAKLQLAHRTQAAVFAWRRRMSRPGL